MTRTQYVRLLNLAIERGEAAVFREHFPTVESCPDSLYENLFPEAKPEPVLELVPDEPEIVPDEPEVT